MPKKDLGTLPVEPQSDECRKGYLIFKAAFETACELLSLYDNPGGKARGQGAPSDAEQDVLRAMLVFAAAGLDSMVKQLIRDGLPAILKQSHDAKEKLVDHFSKRFNRDHNGAFEEVTRILICAKPREALVERLIDDLTSKSLQSADEVYRVCEYLGLSQKKIIVDKKDLRNAFDVRQKIVHELDVDFSRTPKQGQRNRVLRKRGEMVNAVACIFETAKTFLSQVDTAINHGNV